MMLATRCTSCATAFKVVPDQLRVSDGWVRCGRCQAVFNASDSLFEVAALRSPEPGGLGEGVSGWVPSLADDANAPSERSPNGRRDPPLFPDSGGAGLDAVPAVRPQEPAPAPPPDPLSLTTLSAGGPDAEEPSQSALMTLDLPALSAESRADWSAVDPPSDATRAWSSSAMPEEHAPTPQRAAKRGWAWACASLLLLMGIGLQMGFGLRDELVARWPEAQKAVMSACAALGCEVQPVRRLADLSIETSGLRALGDTGYYHLSVTVRNRGRTIVKAPAFELTLSDLQGKAVARRILMPSEFGLPEAVIAARSELPVQIGVSTGSQRIHSYAIDIFYP